jgi:hypothetical protein
MLPALTFKHNMYLLYIATDAGHLYKLTIFSRPRGAVVRAEAQEFDDPCVPGSNPTVGRGCRSFG